MTMLELVGLFVMLGSEAVTLLIGAFVENIPVPDGKGDNINCDGR